MKTSVHFDPLSDDYQQNPFGYYRTMRQEAPAYHVESLDVWALFRYEDVVTTLKRTDRYSSRDWIINALGSSNSCPRCPRSSARIHQTMPGSGAWRAKPSCPVSSGGWNPTSGR